jgi:geranylgeranyl pyrophosphate synthase
MTAEPARQLDTEDQMQECLEDVRTLMAESLAATTLGFLVHENKDLLASGKMLRSRLAFRTGLAHGVPYKTLVHASAAVELIHTASLLHDDVIDGGMIRRGAPAFWVERGVSGAILLGDLLLFKGIDLVCQVADGQLTHDLVKLTGEVCEAESEQELILQGSPSHLEACLRIARRKTGALFAFAALACAKDDEALKDILRESGYQIGTAYQLADDLLDVMGDAEGSGKTLGTDARRDIISAASLDRSGDEDPVTAIQTVLKDSISALKAYPAAQAGMQQFLDEDFLPSIDKVLG